VNTLHKGDGDGDDDDDDDDNKLKIPYSYRQGTSGNTNWFYVPSSVSHRILVTLNTTYKNFHKVVPSVTSVLHLEEE
jgi:hypothetical protein